MVKTFEPADNTPFFKNPSSFVKDDKKDLLKQKQEIEPIEDLIKEEKIDQIKEEEKIDEDALKTAKEKEYLDSIEDKFYKQCLTIEYEFSNQIRDVFKDLNNLKLYEKTTSKEYKKLIENLQDNLDGLVYNITNQQTQIGEQADKISYCQLIKEDIKEFWEVTKSSDTDTHQESRKKLENNSLFSRKIDDIIERSNNIMDKASIFLESIREMSQESLELDKEFNKGRKLKFKGAPNDPFLNSFNKSSAMTRIVMSHMRSGTASSTNSMRTMPKYNKNQNKSLRSNQSKKEEQEKLHKIQTNYVNQMIDKNNLLIKKLEANYDKLNEKLEKTGLYDRYRASEKFRYYKSRLKYDFTDVVVNPDEFEKQNRMLKQIDQVSNNQSNASKNQLIEVKNPEKLQKQLIDAIEQQEAKVKKIKYFHDADAYEEQKIEFILDEPKKSDKKLAKLDFGLKNKSEIDHEVVSDESDGVDEPANSPTEKRSLNNSVGFPFKLNMKSAKEESKNNNNKKATVADQILFDDSSEDDIDELEDEIGDLAFSSSKPMLRKQKTSVPEDLKLTCKPSELLDDFFDDPNEKSHKKLDVSNGKFVKHRSELAKPIQSLKRKPNAYDLMKDKNKHKNEAKPEDKKESKTALKNLLSSDEKQKDNQQPHDTPSKITKSELKEELPEAKVELKKQDSVSKFALKTFYGVKPIDMLKKFENDGQSKAKVQEDKKDDIKEDDIKEDNIKVDDVNQSEPKLVKKDISAIFSASSSQPSKAMFTSSSSKSKPFTGKGGPFSAGKPQGLAPAAFGQSSFGTSSAKPSPFGTKPAEKSENNPIFGGGRTFGGGLGKDNSNPSSAFGFKAIASSANTQSNSFLASGANAGEDNDMATDEDIFGSGSAPSHSMGGFGMHSSPSPFAASKPSPMSFGQPSIPNTSSPAFTQRRK